MMEVFLEVFERDPDNVNLCFSYSGEWGTRETAFYPSDAMKN